MADDDDDFCDRCNWSFIGREHAMSGCPGPWTVDTLRADRDSWKARAEVAERDNAELIAERTFWKEACEKAETECIEARHEGHCPDCGSNIDRFIRDIAERIADWIDAGDCRRDPLGLADDIRAGAWIGGKDE